MLSRRHPCVADNERIVGGLNNQDNFRFHFTMGVPGVECAKPKERNTHTYPCTRFPLQTWCCCNWISKLRVYSNSDFPWRKTGITYIHTFTERERQKKFQRLVHGKVEFDIITSKRIHAPCDKHHYMYRAADWFGLNYSLFDFLNWPLTMKYTGRMRFFFHFLV